MALPAPTATQMPTSELSGVKKAVYYLSHAMGGADIKEQNDL